MESSKPPLEVKNFASFSGVNRAYRVRKHRKVGEGRVEQGSRCAALAVAIDTSDFWQIGVVNSSDLCRKAVLKP